MNTVRESPCGDPRFRLVLIASKLTPGKKVWKLVFVGGKKAE